jgi:hypothetical protein
MRRPFWLRFLRQGRRVAWLMCSWLSANVTRASRMRSPRCCRVRGFLVRHIW